MTARLIRRLLGARLLAVTVTGPSMEPALRDGDRVLVIRRRPHRLTRGHIVVLGPRPGPSPVPPVRPDGGTRVLRAGAPHTGGLLIKRIAAVPGDVVPEALAGALGCPPGSIVPPGRFLVLGDNPTVSLDSRHFGYVARERLLGVAVRPLRPLPAGPGCPRDPGRPERAHPEDSDPIGDRSPSGTRAAVSGGPGTGS
ncbi:S26 family signal peptidase [Kitasatospora sp. NBC_00315]|uniref:S26 family signal peptidase n=1 Tax=Kitasatospora sp. NBC_00315 TaxID=2975963 RepID=UPI0032530844